MARRSHWPYGPVQAANSSLGPFPRLPGARTLGLERETRGSSVGLRQARSKLRHPPALMADDMPIIDGVEEPDAASESRAASAAMSEPVSERRPADARFEDLLHAAPEALMV